MAQPQFNKHVQIAQRLIENGNNAPLRALLDEGVTGLSECSWAQRNGSKTLERREPLFLHAARHGNFEAAQLFAPEGSFAKILNDQTSNALTLASRLGGADFCHWLIDHGCDPNSRFQKHSALSLALDQKDSPNLNFAMALMERGADLNTSIFFEAPSNTDANQLIEREDKLLHRLARLGIQALPLLQFACDHSAALETLNDLGNTPLLVACAGEGNAQAVHILLKAGANPNFSNKKHESILACCADANWHQKTFDETIPLLLRYGANPDVQIQWEDSDQQSRAESFFIRILRGVEVAISNNDLHLAEQYAHLATCLIENGANLQRVNDLKSNPLLFFGSILAATQKQTGTSDLESSVIQKAFTAFCKKLTPQELTASFSAFNSNGASAADYFVAAPHVTHLQLLLDSGLDPNAPCFWTSTNDNEKLLVKDTLLHRYCRGMVNPDQSALCALLLLDAGADPNLTNNRGSNSLLLACSSFNDQPTGRPERLDLIQALLHAGADPFLSNVNEDTPALLAAKKKDIDLLRCLVDPHSKRVLHKRAALSV